MLSSIPKRKRSCVKPVRLILLRAVAPKANIYHPAVGVVLNVPAPANDAVASKSVSCKTGIPNDPPRISIHKLPKILNGLVPIEPVAGLIFNIADLISIKSGKADVSNDKIARYWRLDASSPTTNLPDVALRKPPWLLVSLDSSTQPSCPPTERKLASAAVGVLVKVTVRVFVDVMVNVGVGVSVDGIVTVLVTVEVKAGVSVLVMVWVGPTVLVTLAVFVAVAVFVLVTVLVPVAVAVSMGIPVSVGVSVSVGVKVPTGVGVGKIFGGDADAMSLAISTKMEIKLLPVGE